MKVLIITYYWPPSGGSGVQRWLKFVKYLRNFEIEPVVYTADSPSYAIHDNTLLNEVPDTLEVLKQPIKEPNNLLSFFGGKKKKTSAGFLDTSPSFFGKMAQYIRANYFIPDARKFWVKPSVRFLTKYLSEHDIDIIVTTGPPHSLHLIGMQLKEQLGVKWIADFRDPWTDIDYFHQLPLSEKALRRHHQLEEKVLRAADCVLVVGKTMKQNYTKFNANIEVISNGFDDFLNTGETEPDPKFSIVHIGMMNADRNPIMLWKVLAQLISENGSFARDFQLKLIGKLANEVLVSLKDYRLGSYLEVIEYVAHEEAVNFQKKAQVLLVAVNKVPGAKGIITGKIFEALQAKRPILGLGPTDGDLAEIIDKTQAGTVVDFEDEDTLKITILEMYNQYKKGRLTVDSIDIDQYHRKNLTAKLAKVINSIN